MWRCGCECLVMMLMLVMSSSSMTFHQGGYNELQVALAPSTAQPANCSQLFQHFEMVMRESSRLLHQATDGRAFIRSVNVVLPASWTGDLSSSCRRNVSRTRLDSYSEADVKISSAPHPLFSGGADSLWTQQSRECGQSGDYISAGPDFFFRMDASDEVWIKGRRFLREFTKYRYGVFDQSEGSGSNGQDGLFPGFFCGSTGNSVNATGRSIQPSTRCEPGENCLSNSNSNTPTATAFCDASMHDDMATTQQNLLCQGLSIRDVVWAHHDMKPIPNGGVLLNRMETVFHYKQSAQPRYVLALDKSSPMDERDHWKYVRSATRRLVLHDLSDETELGILSFSDTVQIHTLSEGNSGTGLVRLGSPGSREAVASAIPVFISSGSSAQGSSAQESCLTCALAEAIAMLERGGSSSAGDVIVLITTGSSSADQVQSALALASRKQVRVSVVAFAYFPTLGAGTGALKNLQSLAEATGGRMTAVASKGVGTMSHISMLIQLGDALVATLDYHQGGDSHNVPALVHEQEFGSESASNGWVNGSFYMDPSLGRDTVMAVYFYSRDFNTHVGDIRLVSPDGQEHRGISETAMASLYVTPLAPIDKSGVWRYSFDRRSQSHQSHFVKVTSKLRYKPGTPGIQQKGPLTAKLRVVPPASGDAPFILLATVKSGELPVLDARVRAIIQYTGGNQQDSGVNNTQVLDLLDNGNGDPDVTKGDGVYTRYFGRYFRGSGTYTVTLSVDAMDGRAYTIRSSPSLNPSDMVECCGGVIRVPLERRELTGAFSRLVPGGIISAASSLTSIPSSVNSSMFQQQEEQQMDLLPPSRITDLRVHVEPLTQRVTFQWTAVGDDFDQGTAYAYELRLASNKTWLKSTALFQQAEVLPGAPAPRPSGDQMDLTLMDFDRYDRWFYAAIRAVDRRGNRGRISNLVRLWMPSPPTTTTPPAPLWPSTSLSVNDLPPQWFNGGLSTVHWAAIVAGICVALLILVLAIYFVVAAKRRRDKEQNAAAIGSNNNPSGKNGPPKFAYVPAISFPSSEGGHQLKSASTADLAGSSLPDKEILSQYQSGAVTIYDGRTVPVHWSASQLLQEHERRHSPYGQNEPSDFMTPNDAAFISGSYHLNSGSAIYGGLVPQQQQQQNVYSSQSATPPSDYRPYSIDYEGGSSSTAEQDAVAGYGGYTINSNTKPRPPTFPKPRVSVNSTAGSGSGGGLSNHLPLHGSFTSLTSERKKRNVTQV